jgi:signal transduction histidine kinase
MYPFNSTESFQKEFRTNLVVFTFSTFYFTYTHVMSEMKFINELNRVKERNENLLKILFHDLANPMQTIQMLVKKFSTHRSPEDNDKVFKQLSKTSQRIVDVLEHVRKMKSIEDRKIVLDLKPVHLKNKFAIIQDMFHEKLEAKNIELVLQNDSSDDIHVFADPVYFTHQILANIVSNSIKFTEPHRKIYCSWFSHQKEVTIIIRDEGIGMPKDILKNLFDQNKQVSRKGTQGETGTGYGMPLMKTFIGEFGGAVEVSSIEKTSDQQSEHGTTFKLTLLKA